MASAITDFFEALCAHFSSTLGSSPKCLEEKPVLLRRRKAKTLLHCVLTDSPKKQLSFDCLGLHNLPNKRIITHLKEISGSLTIALSEPKPPPPQASQSSWVELCHRLHYRDGQKVDLSQLMISVDLKEWMMKRRQMWTFNSFIFLTICLSYITWCDILGGFYYILVSKCLNLGCYFLDDFCMVIFPFWGIQTLPALTIT